MRPDACTGCMVCTAVCPADAIAPSSDALLPTLAAVEADTLTVGCGARAGRRHDVTIECLGALDEPTVVTLLLTDGPDLVLDASACASCAAAPGMRSARRALLRGARRVRKAVRRDVVLVTRREDVPLPGRTHDRRGFFRALLAAGAGAVHEVAVGASTADTARPPAGTRQRRLYASIRRAPARAAGARDLLRVPEIADHCTVCRCCAAVCPTAALRRVKRDGTRRIEIDPRACTGCNACMEFCPEDAVRVVPGSGRRRRAEPALA